VPTIGYAAATQVSKKALESGKSILDVVLEMKILPEDQARDLLDPRLMIPESLLCEEDMSGSLAPTNKA
jgi:aspartate ammonia-lyase